MITGNASPAVIAVTTTTTAEMAVMRRGNKSSSYFPGNDNDVFIQDALKTKCGMEVEVVLIHISHPWRSWRAAVTQPLVGKL